MKRRTLTLLLTVATVFMWNFASVAQEEVTQVVAVSIEDGLDATLVRITTNRRPAYETFTLENGTIPLKLALDFRNALMVTNTEHLTMAQGPVKQVRVSQWFQAPPIVRVMIDFRTFADYTIAESPEGLQITIPHIFHEPVAATPMIMLPAVPVSDTVVPDAARENAIPGARAEASLPAPQVVIPSPDSPGQPVRVILNYVNTSLITILRVFAELYNLNIVIASEVAEDPITVKLHNVNLEPALYAILTANGYSYYRRENIIIVKSADTEIAGELITEVFKLRFINAADVVRNLEPLISERGQVSAFLQEPMGEVGVELPLLSSGQTGGASAQQTDRVEIDTERSDVLIVTDIPEVIERIRKIIIELDVPPKQVRINVRLIETTVTQDQRVGINWTANMELIGRGGQPANAGQGAGQQLQTNDQGETIIPGVNIRPGGFRFGTLSIAELSAFLDMLDQQGNTRVLNQPSITVMNNQQADIAVGTLIPIELQQPVINASGGGGGGGAQTQGGGVLIQQQFVSIALTVIPRINDDRYVTLWVQPVISEITGFTGKNNDLPIVSARSANTTVRVRDTDTVIIGGLNKRDQIRSIRKVKFLGDMPLFGRFFRHETISEVDSELLIFITPFIIRGEDFGTETAFNAEGNR